MLKKTSYLHSKSLSSLAESNSFDIINSFTADNIKGGDPSPSAVSALIASLGNIFVRTSNCLDASWNEFNKEIGLLATTNVGFDMLTQIVNSANGKHISVTGNSPNMGKNAAQYHDNTGSGGSIDLGDLEVPTAQSGAFQYLRGYAVSFGTIAHELFHAEAFIVNGNTASYQSYSRNARYELDAYMFEAMANIEIDEKNNTTDLNNSYAYLDYNLYASPNQHPSGTNQASISAFQNAYYDMFHNKNFTLTNYNILTSTLTTSSQQGVDIGKSYSPATQVTQDQFNTSEIEKFYTNDFSKSSYFNNHTPLFPFNPPSTNGTASGNPINDDTGHQTIHYNADGTADTGSSGTGTGIGGGGASSGGPSTGSNSLGGAGFGYGIGVTGSAGSDGSSGSASGGSNASSSDDTGAGTTNNTGTTSPPAGTKPPLKGFR